MSFDYSVFSITEASPEEVRFFQYDVLISAYNSSDRVLEPFEIIGAPVKIWFVHAEYGYADSSGEVPRVQENVRLIHTKLGDDELDSLASLMRLLSELEISGESNLCVDITGMMRPHLMLLPILLKAYGFESVDFIYSDPSNYVAGASTSFSVGALGVVRQVAGFQGVHRTDSDSDYLIVGGGYDSRLVAAVAEDRRYCTQVVLLGLPGLQPHMYQESQLSLSSAFEGSTSRTGEPFLFAPANNPFATASVLSEYFTSRALTNNGNVYLAPLGSKCQVLGFAWFFLCEMQDTSTSIIFPFPQRYSRETSQGWTRTSVFRLELNCIGAL